MAYGKLSMGTGAMKGSGNAGTLRNAVKATVTQKPKKAAKTTGDSLGQALGKPKTSKAGYRPAAQSPKGTGRLY